MNEFNVRSILIRDHCSSRQQAAAAAAHEESPLISERLLVMKYRKLVWCPVYKAASTSWMKLLPRLSNFSPMQLNAIKTHGKGINQPNDLAEFVAKPLKPFSFQYFMRQGRKNPEMKSTFQRYMDTFFQLLLSSGDF